VEDTFGKSKFIPNGIQENYKVKLPDWFWDKIGLKIQIEQSNKDFSYYNDDINTINFGEVCLLSQYSGT
jgi:hypothetical protein